MTLQFTAIYAIIIVLLAMVLGARVSILRAKTKISILHGDNMQLAERMRMHANLTESAPLALILMGLVEMNGASPAWLHAIGICLVAGRVIHPFGIVHDNPAALARGIGSGLTSLSMLVAMAFLLWALLG